MNELQRQVEYKFAPVPLLAVQALANTYSFEDEEELLGDVVAARQWLVDSDLANREVAVRARDLEGLRTLRKAVRDLMAANLGRNPDGTACRDLAALLAAHPVALTAGEDGRLGVDLAPVSSVDELISQFVGIVFRAQVEREWPRLKICACDECRWAFYDASRNRGGTWCQMEVCGNRIKNRRYRQRSARARN